MFFCVALKLEPGPQVRALRLFQAATSRMVPAWPQRAGGASLHVHHAPQPSPAHPSLSGGLSSPCTQELRMQEDELVGVQWMPLDEYLAIDFHTSRPLLRQIQAACVAWADGKYR